MSLSYSTFVPRVGLEFALRHGCFSNASIIDTHIDALGRILGTGPFVQPLRYLQQYTLFHIASHIGSQVYQIVAG